MYANWVKAPRRQVRRRHAEEFKRQVIAASLQPGISIAAVALANGLNANLLRRWVKDHRDAQAVEVGAKITPQDAEHRPPDYSMAYDPPVEARLPDDDNPGPTLIMPRRRTKLVTPARN